MTTDFPRYCIAGQHVFELAFAPKDTSRAFNRDLVDFQVELTDVVAEKTSGTLVALSSELDQDYKSFKQPVPIRWLLARFLMHHVAAGDHNTLAKPDGPALLTTTYTSYLGESLPDEVADTAVIRVLQSFLRSGVREPISLASLFASTNLTLNSLQRTVNALIARGLLKPNSDDSFVVESTVFAERNGDSGRGAEPSPVSNYYQEIKIEAQAPFCFVIMPFREREHPQRQYFDLIKPLLKNEFGITCYRVDEDALPDRIDNKIYTYMLRAEFVIAEITTANPNVMYELGMAHTLNKPCILLTQNTYSQLPFDVSRITIEPYTDEESLKKYLRRVVSALRGIR
ncbi:MAG: hypothetical protein ABL888_04680 [Pirellulaceae bacterium]